MPGVLLVVSMTGFGSSQLSSDGILVKVELRSVNHRFLDSSIRVPKDHPTLERRIRERVTEQVARGRVSVSVEVKVEDTSASIVLDEELAGAYQQVLARLSKDYGADGKLDPIAFAALPDVVRRENVQIASEVVEAAVDEALGLALGQLVAMRREEGAALGADLARRIDTLDSCLEGIEEGSRGLTEAARTRLAQKVESLIPEGASPDQDRLATEVALIAEKADITEELVRFRAHNHAFRGFLQKEEPIGKRLDFLLQEMNREANTIASKSPSAEVSHQVVELKQEIERLREQVQNVE